MAPTSSGWVTAVSVTHSDKISYEYSPTPIRKRQTIGNISALSRDGARVMPTESPVESDNVSITSSDLNNPSHETPSSMADTRVGPAPKFNHEALQQSLQGEQLRALQMLTKIRHIVEWKVGQEMSAPADTKHPKIGELNKYSGGKSHNTFCTWLNQFLNWLRSYYICGDSTDSTQVNLLGNYLEGSALDWYTAGIDNPDICSGRPMEFINAICRLHQQFVQMAMANDAKTKYESVVYSSTNGTEGYYYKLDKYASRMVQQPDEYSFKARFCDGLPNWIYNQLADQQIYPEYCTMDDVCTKFNVQQIEELKSCVRGPVSGLTDHGAEGQQREATRVEHCRRPQKVNHARPNCGPQKIPPRPSSTHDAQPAQRTPHNGTKNLHNHALSSRALQSTKNLTCYKCGKEGHILSNPKCPQYTAPLRPRFNAQRLLEQDKDIPEEVPMDVNPVESDMELEYSNSWGGSQYDHEEGVEEPPHNNDGAEPAPEGEDDSDDSANERTIHLPSMSV
jgi:hypothetical protein